MSLGRLFGELMQIDPLVPKFMNKLIDRGLIGMAATALDVWNTSTVSQSEQIGSHGVDRTSAIQSGELLEPTGNLPDWSMDTWLGHVQVESRFEKRLDGEPYSLFSAVKREPRGNRRVGYTTTMHYVAAGMLTLPRYYPAEGGLELSKPKASFKL